MEIDFGGAGIGMAQKEFQEVQAFLVLCVTLLSLPWFALHFAGGLIGNALKHSASLM